jgi:hypothetical protein
VDYDLALCSDAQQRCIAFSNSLDDTNEGFDILFSEDFTGSDALKLYVLKPPGSVECQGPTRGAFEPFGIAAVVFHRP